MKAILVDENKNLVWSDVPDPIIGDDEVLVKICSALNIGVDSVFEVVPKKPEG